MVSNLFLFKYLSIFFKLVTLHLGRNIESLEAHLARNYLEHDFVGSTINHHHLMIKVLVSKQIIIIVTRAAVNSSATGLLER
jgi:hypothetical protein